jgi:hypothetical protein
MEVDAENNRRNTSRWASHRRLRDVTTGTGKRNTYPSAIAIPVSKPDAIRNLEPNRNPIARGESFG